MDTRLDAIAADIRQQGFAFVPADRMQKIMPAQAVEGWADFADSWNRLDEDRHMGDGGRYRQRLHAAFRVTAQEITRKPHQPHYQSLAHNGLNGGVQRWFGPVTSAIGGSATNIGVLNLCRNVFARVAEDARPGAYHTEMHQFRIEPAPDQVGKPTPEGMHRDGVDWVCVMLVNRENVKHGVTDIVAPDGQSLASFTMTKPMDCVFLDDRRVLHGVTPIGLMDPARKGHRDVLVMTYQGGPAL